jgi:hypothetical protein
MTTDMLGQQMVFSPRTFILRKRNHPEVRLGRWYFLDLSAPYSLPGKQRLIEFSLKCSYEGKTKTSQPKPST